jgi:uncharacterized membrane-anchored protein
MVSSIMFREIINKTMDNSWQGTTLGFIELIIFAYVIGWTSYHLNKWIIEGKANNNKG